MKINFNYIKNHLLNHFHNKIKINQKNNQSTTVKIYQNSIKLNHNHNKMMNLILMI
jgi:hypothetical protein